MKGIHRIVFKKNIDNKKPTFKYYDFKNGKRNIELKEYSEVAYFLDLPIQDVKKVYNNYELLMNTPATETIFKYD